ncbi:MAG: hypothetical protein ACREEJ_06470 [Ensifer adhaerens]
MPEDQENAGCKRENRIDLLARDAASKKRWSLRKNTPKARFEPGTHYLDPGRRQFPAAQQQLAGHRYRMVIEDLTKDESRLFLNFFRDIYRKNWCRIHDRKSPDCNRSKTSIAATAIFCGTNCRKC